MARAYYPFRYGPAGWVSPGRWLWPAETCALLAAFPKTWYYIYRDDLHVEGEGVLSTDAAHFFLCQYPIAGLGASVSYALAADAIPVTGSRDQAYMAPSPDAFVSAPDPNSTVKLVIGGVVVLGVLGLFAYLITRPDTRTPEERQRDRDFEFGMMAGAGASNIVGSLAGRRIGRRNRRRR